jgi:hypothetical protein
MNVEQQRTFHSLKICDDALVGLELPCFVKLQHTLLGMKKAKLKLSWVNTKFFSQNKTEMFYFGIFP